MWDNPRLLNAAAGALTALALLVFAIGAVQLVLRSSLFPLREVQLRGELAHTTGAEVEQAVRGRIEGNFFASTWRSRAPRWSSCPGCGACRCAACGPTASR